MLKDTVRPLMLNFDGFSPAQLTLTLTTTDDALELKPEHVAPFCHFGVLVLIGLTLTTAAGPTGVPPEHPAKVAFTVVISFFTPAVPADVKGGLKLIVPPK